MANISSVIKAIQDIMRKDTGINGDAQRLSQIVWILFLKIFADKEEELALLDDNYKSPIPENLRWQNWAIDEEGITGDKLINFIDGELIPGLKQLQGTSLVAQWLRLCLLMQGVQVQFLVGELR